jgi:CHAD domain-containing protein
LGEVTRYLLICLGRIVLHLKKFKAKRQDADIHQIRVNIKKFHAIARMMNQLNKSDISFKGLDKLFEDAGEIRELQIDIDVLNKKQNHPSKRIKKLKENLGRNKKRFIKHIPDYIHKLNKIENKLLEVNSDWPTVFQIKKYFKQLSAVSLQSPVIRRKELHRLRSKLKRMQYIHEALPTRMRKKINLQHKALDQLQEKIGKWHDLYVTTQLLKKHKLNSKKNFEEVLKNEKHTFKILCEIFPATLFTERISG